MSKSLSPCLPLVIALWGAAATTLSAQTIRIDEAVGASLTPTGVYWNFDDGAIGTTTPGVTADQSGNGFHGTLQAAQVTDIYPTYAAGKYGAGVSITPSSVTPSADRDPNVFWNAGTAYAGQLDFVAQSFTGGAWLKLNELSQPTVTQRIYIMERGYSGSTQNSFTFRLTRWANQPSNWVFELGLGNGTVANILLSSSVSGALTLGEWSHLGFTYEYGATESTVTFWLNGEQLGDSLSTDYKLAATSAAAQRTFRVGERSVSSYMSNWNGVIDDVFVTSGAYQFTAIPEPSAMLSMVAGGAIMLLRFRRRLC